MRLFAVWIGAGAAALAAQGCWAQSGAGAAEPPVKTAAKARDLAVSSHSGNDEQRGREQRERERRLDKLRKTYSKQLAKCQGGNRYACDAALVTEGEIHDVAAAKHATPN